jgi:hypothetical protein
MAGGRTGGSATLVKKRYVVPMQSTQEPTVHVVDMLHALGDGSQAGRRR